jgi:hypothetical protein
MSIMNAPSASQKINIDNKARLGYLDGHCCRLVGVTICWAAAEADTQFTRFDLSAFEKQYLFFLVSSSLEFTDMTSRFLMNIRASLKTPWAEKTRIFVFKSSLNITSGL